MKAGSEKDQVDQAHSPNDRLERMYEKGRKLTIYLAGALTNQSDSVAMDWRNNFRVQFGEEFDVVLPQDKWPRMEHLKGSEKWHAAIVAGERRDIVNCNAVVANIDTISMGTAMGILYAYLGGRTVVLLHSGSEVERECISPLVLFHSHKMCSTAESAVNFIRTRHSRRSLEELYSTQEVKVKWNEDVLENEISKAFRILKEEKRNWTSFLDEIDPLKFSDAVVMQLEDHLEEGVISYEVLGSDHIRQITEKLFMSNSYRDEVSDLAKSYIRYRDRLKRRERSNQYAEDTQKKVEGFLHDIKSPIGNLKRVMEDDLPQLKELATSEKMSNKIDESFEWIGSNITAAEQLVENTRQETKEEYEISTFCLTELINEIVDSYHGIDFDTSGVEEDLFVETNKFKFRSILNVLTDNARDHGFIAGEDQKIVISAGSETGKSAWIEYWNAGTTITRVEANQILSGSIKRASSGWGVGLSQLESDVGDMGGSVCCDPCILIESTEGAISISEADIGPPRFRFDWDDIQRKNPGKSRILVADDEEIARINVQRILKEEFDVVLCDSIDKAIELATEQPFFGAVLDVDFKEENRDGINLAVILKEMDPSIKIVVVSGRHSRLASGDDWRVRAEQAGALKSFDKADYRSVDLLREFRR